MGYTVRAIKGVGWVTLLQLVVRVLSILKFVFIARLIVPFQLGLFGIAMLTLSFLESVTDTGIASFLVQTDQKEEKYLSSAWLVGIARGFLLFLITIVLAYPVSVFFNDKSALNLILLASLIPLIKGFANPLIVKFQKNLTFHKEFIYRFSITIFDLVICVVLLMIMKNAYALVLSLVLSTIFETILSFVVIRSIPGLFFDKQKILELAHFGKWITMIGATNYFARQLDSIVVGKFLGTESLGIYQLSQKFSIQIISEAGDVFSRITFPVFSKIRHDLVRTRRALIRTLTVAFSLFGAITLFIFFFSKDLLLVLAGSQWLAADIPMKFFSLTGLITAIMAIVTSLFLACARQDITAKLIIVRLIILAILIVPSSIYFGIIGTSFVSFLSYLLVMPIAYLGVKQILRSK